MKQTLKIILFSSLIGTILAGLFFLNVKDKAEAKIAPTIKAFQVGVYKNENNATASLDNYSVAKIVKDNDFYRVFIGITVNNKELMENWFQKQGYNYYIKEIPVNEEIYNEIVKYDTLLLKTSEDTKEKVFAKMLESMPNEL